MKNWIVILGHCTFLLLAIWTGWDNKTTMFFSVIPILSSLFFYITANIYTIIKSIHFLREYIYPVKFNWKFTVKINWKDDFSLKKDKLKPFLESLSDFEIMYPSTTNDFIIKNNGRNTQVKTVFNLNSTVFTLSYDAWTVNEFKKNIDNYDGKLFEFIVENFNNEKQQSIYSIIGQCDKVFTTSEMWKLISEKNNSKIDIVFNHEMESEKAFLTILRDEYKEEIQIPTTFSLNKMSSLIEDYSNLSFLK